MTGAQTKQELRTWNARKRLNQMAKLASFPWVLINVSLGVAMIAFFFAFWFEERAGQGGEYFPAMACLGGFVLVILQGWINQFSKLLLDAFPDLKSPKSDSA